MSRARCWPAGSAWPGPRNRETARLFYAQMPQVPRTPSHEDVLAAIRALLVTACETSTSAADVEAVANLGFAYAELVEHRPPARGEN